MNSIHRIWEYNAQDHWRLCHDSGLHLQPVGSSHSTQQRQTSGKGCQSGCAHRHLPTDRQVRLRLTGDTSWSQILWRGISSPAVQGRLYSKAQILDILALASYWSNLIHRFFSREWNWGKGVDITSWKAEGWAERACTEGWVHSICELLTIMLSWLRTHLPQLNGDYTYPASW